jgi:hypothetical protein
MPGDRHLAKNQQAAWDGWARGYIEAGKCAEAIDIYRKALERYPGNRAFLNNIKYCEQQASRRRPRKRGCCSHCE